MRARRGRPSARSATPRASPAGRGWPRRPDGPHPSRIPDRSGGRVRRIDVVRQGSVHDRRPRAGLVDGGVASCGVASCGGTIARAAAAPHVRSCPPSALPRSLRRPRRTARGTRPASSIRSVASGPAGAPCPKGWRQVRREVPPVDRPTRVQDQHPDAGTGGEPIGRYPPRRPAADDAVGIRHRYPRPRTPVRCRCPRLVVSCQVVAGRRPRPRIRTRTTCTAQATWTAT